MAFPLLIITLVAVFVVGCGVSLMSFRAFKSKASQANELLAQQLLQQGWASVVFTPKTKNIEYVQGVKQLFASNKSFHVVDELAAYLDATGEQSVLAWLTDCSLDDQECSKIIRLDDGKVLECVISRCEWRGQEAHMLMLRFVSKAYKQMLLTQSENKTLKSENALHSNILNHASLPMWARAEDMSIRYCNLPYMEMIEETDAAIMGDSMPELFSGMKRLADMALHEKETQTKRTSIVVGGQRRLFHVTEFYVPSSHATIGFAQDITELEQVEAELEKQLATLEDVLDSSSSAMTIYGADGKLQFYNQAYARIWGLDEAWLAKEPTFSETLEHLRELRRLPEQVNFPAFKQQRLRIFSEATEPQEELFYLPDGRTLRNVTIPHSAGGILFIYEDVTDRLALERSYNTSLAVQRETLDNLHEGVVVFGEDGKLRLKNPVFMVLWNLEEKDFADGTHIADFIEKTKHFYRTSNWDAFKSDFIAKAQSRSLYTSRIERKDGAVLDYSAVPLPDGGVLLTYTDMTATTLVERSLREKNDALEAGDKLKTEFLANMSYELRSPLTSISGFAEMLQQQYCGEFSSDQMEYIDGIYKSSQQLMHLINDILDLSSIEAGYLALNMRDFDISQLLGAMMTLLAERLREFKLTASIECDDDIGTMNADETRIRQMLFHLLSNAVKYSKEGGEITLGARKGDKGVYLWVKDEGIGISKEEQQAVFDKFYRGNAGVRKSGTGLGLSMVKNFVELHGGDVMLESTLDKGTKVTCFIPNDPPKQRPTTQSVTNISLSDYDSEGAPTLH